MNQKFRSEVNYESFIHLDYVTMDGGALDSAFRVAMNLSVENSVEFEELQKQLSIAEARYELAEDKKAIKPILAQIRELKRSERINVSRSRNLNKCAMRLSTLLRTFGR